MVVSSNLIILDEFIAKTHQSISLAILDEFTATDAKELSSS